MQSDELVLLKRRSELLIVVTSAVVMGISANIIAGCLTGQVPIKYLPIPIVTIIVPLFWLAQYFLGELVLESIPMILLINRENGTILPFNYPPAAFGSSALGRLEETMPEVLQTLNKGMPEGNEPVLRDLIEYIVVSWLQSTGQFEMTPDGRVIFPPVPLPESGKRIKGRDILGKFGENVFAGVFMDMHDEVTVPRSATLIAKRHESKEVKISMAVGDEPVFMRVIGGQVGGSELVLKGSLLSPLDFFLVRTFVERVSPGVTLYLFLQGLAPVMSSPEKVVCKEKATGRVRTVEGGELEECKKWIEVDCKVIVGYRMKGVLFWHPSFSRWYYWCESMKRHAKHWFDFTQCLQG